MEWILLVVISKLQDASTIDCVAILQRRTCSSWWERSPFIKENRGDCVGWGLSSSEYSILVLRCSLLKEEGTDKCELSNTRNLQTEQSSSQPIFQMREQYIRLDAGVNTTGSWWSTGPLESENACGFWKQNNAHQCNPTMIHDHAKKRSQNSNAECSPARGCTLILVRN